MSQMILHICLGKVDTYSWTFITTCFACTRYTAFCVVSKQLGRLKLLQVDPLPFLWNTKYNISTYSISQFFFRLVDSELGLWLSWRKLRVAGMSKRDEETRISDGEFSCPEYVEEFWDWRECWWKDICFLKMKESLKMVSDGSKMLQFSCIDGSSVCV